MKKIIVTFLSLLALNSCANTDDIGSSRDNSTLVVPKTINGCHIIRTHKTKHIRVDINRGCFGKDPSKTHVGVLFRNGYTTKGLAQLKSFVRRSFGYVRLVRIMHHKVKVGKTGYYILAIYRIDRRL